MLVGSSRGSVVRLVIWQWRFAVMSLAASTAITLIYMLLDQSWFLLPTAPLAVVGATLGIFVSFRTNSSYDRWWEGRKLWGRLINTSRHITVQTIHYLPEDQEEEKQRFVRRHIGYVHTLRCLLRGQEPLADKTVQAYLDASQPQYQKSSNLTAVLLSEHLGAAKRYRDEGLIDDFRLSDMDESVRHLFDIQGGCERIKKTPLPRAYAFISENMILWFTVLFPCGIVGQLEWLSIPISFLVAFCFKLISETGRVLEDPFSIFWNGLPLTALSTTIEVNLLELLGEEELPPMTEQSPLGVLM